ncbi:MAG: T9SS type A sorting domain-containing protein, partial [Bacteroidales bacterium]|nr:T9SS type A sorting domain-containing protein [Bacteroidales bacterium]
QGNLILLPHPVVEKVSSVSVEDVVLADEMWKHIPGKGWVVVSDEIPLYPPVAVKYKHSPHGDMVITNWDSGKGNFIYYNTNEPVGIPENNVQDELEVYPNPADDFIYIDFGRIHHSCNISILDQHGRQILHTDISNTANARIACPQFPAGMYILKCAIDGNIKAKKFFIIHK